eukprot:11853254-Karenia_brevis.AAC.1
MPSSNQGSSITLPQSMQSSSTSLPSSPRVQTSLISRQLAFLEGREVAEFVSVKRQGEDFEAALK